MREVLISGDRWCMANAERVLEEAIREFEEKARGWGKRQELIVLAELAFEAGEAAREGKDFPDDRAKAVLHPSRTHDLDKPPERLA